MIDIVKKEECCGCTACDNICPMHSIQMKCDEEGFNYPFVDKEICINCGLCEQTCPVMNPIKQTEYNREGYIARNRDAQICNESTSGGVASALIQKLFEQGYIVCGAAFDQEFNVIHTYAHDTIEAEGFRGSKFVQSELKNIFTRIKKDLVEGKKITFIGTPCQVHGLKKYLRKDYENLFCIDFICRGVPSPKVWDMYKSEMQKKYRSNFKSVKFRNKTYGYHSSTMRVCFTNGKEYYASGRIDPMMRAFVSELVSRPSCHNCHFKNIAHTSDITLFDCKNYHTVIGKPDDDKGYTSIIVQSSKGKKLLCETETLLEMEQADLKKMVECDGIMVMNSATANKSRKIFFETLNSNSLSRTMHNVYKIKCIDYIIERAKRFLYVTGLIKLARKMKKSKMKVAK